MDLLSAWSEWNPTTPPFVLDGDSVSGVTFKSWQAAVTEPDFCKPNDQRLHLGLLPMPFIGDLRRATIYILSLNPGLGPHDYYGEYKVPAYRRALLANLKQKFNPGTVPFLFLDPQYSWHGGFRWWHGKLRGIIAKLADIEGIAFANARTKLANEIASIELFPYHSSRFHGGRGWKGLKSVELAQKFVRDVVLPRVEKNEAIAVVIRKAKLWGIPHRPGIVLDGGGEAQAAHLTPRSRGGRAIVKRLTKIGR
jgi:hypothetical protein